MHSLPDIMCLNAVRVRYEIYPVAGVLLICSKYDNSGMIKNGGKVWDSSPWFPVNRWLNYICRVRILIM